MKSSPNQSCPLSSSPPGPAALGMKELSVRSRKAALPPGLRFGTVPWQPGRRRSALGRGTQALSHEALPGPAGGGGTKGAALLAGG